MGILEKPAPYPAMFPCTYEAGVRFRRSGHVVYVSIISERQYSAGRPAFTREWAYVYPDAWMLDAEPVLATVAARMALLMVQAEQAYQAFWDARTLYPDLSQSVWNVMDAAGFRDTPEAFFALSDGELLRMRGVGRGMVQRIRQAQANAAWRQRWPEWNAWAESLEGHL